MTDVGMIMAYEEGELDAQETLELFADLIRTGMAWQLQGYYGRTAAHLIESGIINEDGEISPWALDDVYDESDPNLDYDSSEVYVNNEEE